MTYCLDLFVSFKVYYFSSVRKGALLGLVMVLECP